jgi:hypothetical protein
MSAFPFGDHKFSSFERLGGLGVANAVAASGLGQLPCQFKYAEFHLRFGQVNAAVPGHGFGLGFGGFIGLIVSIVTVHELANWQRCPPDEEKVDEEKVSDAGPTPEIPRIPPTCSADRSVSC